MRYLILLFGFMGSVGAAWSEPVEWPVDQGGNGHYYEVFGGIGSAYDGMSWTEADELAKAMTFQGDSGHLVTLTSYSEVQFLNSLPGISCNILTWDPPCLDWHLGGWSIVTTVIDPQPYNPPFVETIGEQWITGEAGVVPAYPVSSVNGPVGEVIFFKLGIYSLDGFGYPDYGPHAVPGPSTATGFVVEYDGLSAYSYPDGTVPTTNSSWGEVKALYR